MKREAAIHAVQSSFAKAFHPTQLGEQRRVVLKATFFTVRKMERMGKQSNHETRDQGDRKVQFMLVKMFSTAF